MLSDFRPAAAIDGAPDQGTRSPAKSLLTAWQDYWRGAGDLQKPI